MSEILNYSCIIFLMIGAFYLFLFCLTPFIPSWKTKWKKYSLLALLFIGIGFLEVFLMIQFGIPIY